MTAQERHDRFGQPTWTWTTSDGWGTVEITDDPTGGQAANLRADFDAQGVGLTAQDCREIAAVLTGLADKKERAR